MGGVSYIFVGVVLKIRRAHSADIHQKNPHINPGYAPELLPPKKEISGTTRSCTSHYVLSNYKNVQGAPALTHPLVLAHFLDHCVLHSVSKD